MNVDSENIAYNKNFYLENYWLSYKNEHTVDAMVYYEFMLPYRIKYTEFGSLKNNSS
jgi:hypothetical protein